ncbi:hypothetical protein A3A60_02955 [Candidatus Curtissbacteria bacterium RIFCSPLOWO2_01_FULL_42_26]|uniref:Uncharacterized protein n=1 Tax=Candidatus Curtissbacteria bacterium RIFCSPLOWO2_01_FULL_42_26 TaxID=1797729 RepID=A0A1F5I225_9BACT|nr:MAG: hypothetical protein A3A60_02955 [Candidatus Curtissbacteria bacterium RIFCSPLOWO2_01_FULL_42_26]
MNIFLKTIVLIFSFVSFLFFTVLTVPIFAENVCPAGYNLVTGPTDLCVRPKPPDCTPPEVNGPNFCAISPTAQNPPGNQPPVATGTADISPFPLPDTPELTLKGFTAGNLIGKLIGDILPIVLGIAGFLTVIFVIISGIQFVTSSGNPEAAAAARSRLIFALVGFIVIILAFAITQIVDRIFLGGSGIFQ